MSNPYIKSEMYKAKGNDRKEFPYMEKIRRNGLILLLPVSYIRQ